MGTGHWTHSDGKSSGCGLPAIARFVQPEVRTHKDGEGAPANGPLPPRPDWPLRPDRPTRPPRWERAIMIRLCTFLCLCLCLCPSGLFDPEARVSAPQAERHSTSKFDD